MKSPAISRLLGVCCSVFALGATLPDFCDAAAPFSLFTRSDLPVGSQNSVAIADFNHDGRNDFAATFFASTVSVFLGQGGGTFGPVSTFPLGQSGAQGVIAADVNADGNPDLLSGSQNSNTLSVLLGSGDGAFAAPLTSAGLGGKFVRVADFNNDGRLDVVGNGSGIAVGLGNGSGTFGPRMVVTVIGCPVEEIMTADFNGDGRQDLAVLNPCPFGKVSILLGNGDGTFQAQADYPLPSSPRFGVVGDLNGDGHPDLAVSATNGILSVLLGNADGTFLPRTDTIISSDTGGIKIGDLNSDGHPDIAVTTHDIDILFLLAGNGDGTFDPPLGFPCGHRPFGLWIGELNGDALLDLITPVIDVAGPNGGLSIFFNASGPPAGIAPVLTAPVSVTVTEGSTVSFTVTASDPDGPAIDRLFDDVDLAGRTFTPNASNTSADWSWTPPFGTGGTGPYTVIFTARNTLASRAITRIQVDKIVSANPPVLAQPANMTVTEGFTADQTLSATDADGDPLTFTKVSGPTFMSVITTSQGTGSATGVIHLTPGPADAGTYPVTVRASDHARDDDKSLTITVVDSPGTPTLEPIAGMFVCVGRTADQEITATDPDGGAITFTSSGPPWMTVTSNQQVGTTRTGNIHLAPVFDFGNFQGTVTATANGQSHSRTFAITVGQCIGPPVLAQPANMTVTEGQTANQTLSATDANGDPLTFFNVSGPVYMTVTTTTPGAGTATGNVRLAPGFSDAGSATVTVGVSDGSLSDSKSFSITVLNSGNRCPTANPGGPYPVIVGVPVSFDGTASFDPDGDPLTFAWDFGDGATAVGPTPLHTYTAAGTFTVTLAVTDNASPPCSDTATTTATIVESCPAAVFNGYDVIRLNSGRPRWFAFVEPGSGCYVSTDVVLSSFVLKYAGNQIPADGSKTFIESDKNGDGAQEIRVAFLKPALRTLFAGLPDGHNVVEVTIEANLVTGGILQGTTQVDVVVSGSSTAATVAPNPLNPAAMLTFTTTRPGLARVEMFDIAGRLVRTILDERSLPEGVHDVKIDGRGSRGEGLASGIYFIRGVSAEGEFTKTIAILK